MQCVCVWIIVGQRSLSVNMNFFKKRMAKHYVKKRKFYFIAFAFALISVILMVVAIILDELSGVSDAAFCGFLALGPLTYADCVDTDGCASAQLAGIMWITWSILGCIMCFIAPALLGVKKSLSFIPYIFAVIFYILAIVLWISDNPLCWGDQGALGISLILAMVAVFFALIALIFGAYPKCCKK